MPLADGLVMLGFPAHNRETRERERVLPEMASLVNKVHVNEKQNRVLPASDFHQIAQIHFLK